MDKYKIIPPLSQTTVSGSVTPSELRIGNLIYTRNSDYSEKAKKGWDLSEILQINIYGGGYCNLGKEIGKRYNDIDKHCYFSDKCELKPIVLNRDWLISLGFVEDENEELVLKNDLANIVQTCFMGLWKIKVEMIGNTECITILNEDFLYVHQLQNLYFALTGSELQLVL